MDLLFRLRVRTLPAGCLALLFFLAVAGLAQTPPQVGVFFDGPAEPTGKAYLHALFLENLLGHFDLKADIVPVAAYRAGQLPRYRAAFFIGAAPSAKLPAAFLADVKNSTRPFCWLGQHIGDLVNAPAWRGQYGFSFESYGEDLGYNKVSYKDTLLPKGEGDLNIIAIRDPQAVEVVASTVNDNKVWRPYVLRQKRFWYFADTPFSYMAEGGRYLVLCDLLHDILEIQHSADKRALLRIEDVSVDDEPGDLREVAALLAGHGVPFQIGLIPIYRNPPQSREIHLSDRRSFVQALRYMISRGGTPIMHGVTHQFRGVSADDYEFWDDAADRPIPGDSADMVLRKLQLGLADCFASGIFPVSFETPHYAASQTDYQAFKRIFSLFYDRTMAAPRQESQQYFPYPLTDRFGRRVLPEDLGYLPADKPDPRVLLENARNLRVVRDGIASFYFHPFLDVKLLDQVVQGITGLGYRFVSIREFGAAVDFQGRYLVRTSSGAARVRPHNEYWRLRLFDAAGQLTKTQISPKPVDGPVDLAVQVPQGGWAAIDCPRELPVAVQPPSWRARLRAWWARAFHRPTETTPEIAPFVSGKNAWILWLDKGAVAETNDQQSYRSVLETFGYQTRSVRLKDFSSAPAEPGTVLCIPFGAGQRLSEKQQLEIVRFLEAGGNLVTGGRQPWLRRLGFQWLGRQVSVTSISEVLYPDAELVWQPAAQVERVTPPENARALLLDKESDQTLAFWGERGRGRYLYLATPLDRNTTLGTSRYPYLARYLSETFGSATSVRNPRLEVYCDPSFRAGADLNRLATSWRRSGIRTVYVAAWIFTASYSYNYSEFIRACHRQGISVYAWFVFPAVTQRMWEEHPEWRERTASGADGKVGWRYLMNFQNPACFRAAMDWMNGLLKAHDWDGVNIAELNFDADFDNYLRSDSFVPLNTEARAEFKKKAGFDPLLLFKPGSEHHHATNNAALQKFLRYREDLVTEWHRQVLKELEPLRRERSWEVIVTMLDSLHSKYVRPALGVDSRRIVGLMKEFNFTLQIEDPAEHWNRSPDRYRRFAQTYLKLAPEARRVMFDVNVMPDRDISRTSLPSATATGTELARTVAAAASASGRVAIYAENTVLSQDWPLLKIALGTAARLEGSGRSWSLSSPAQVQLISPDYRDYYVDGRLWPAVSADGVLVPAGKHRISTERPWWHFLDPSTLEARVVGGSADILDARGAQTGLDLRYQSPGRAVLLFDQKPREIYLDGKPADIPAEASGPNWAAVFPGGEHSLTVVTNTRAGVAVNVWSWASASAIAAFGGLSTALMIFIYLHLRVRRLARRRSES